LLHKITHLIGGEIVDKRTLRVQGRGFVTAEPDQATLSFDVEATRKEYKASINRLNQRVEHLRSDLESVAVELSKLKTRSFSVSPKYERINGRNIFKGYVASHSLAISLPLDKELLNKVLGKVSESASKARLFLSFGLKDATGFKKRAMEEAVANGKANAEILAKSAGVTLSDLLQIDYGWAEVRFRHEIYEPSYSIAAEPSPPPDIEPSDVSTEESVTLIYELK
jgi:hypothetical protein